MPRKGKLWRRFIVLTLVLTASGSGLFLAWPQLFPSLVARGQVEYERGNWRKAEALANARLKSAPSDLDALRLLARAAVRQGMDKPARAVYSRLGGASAMKAEDFYLMGVALNRAGDRETARECWATGLLADPTHPELLREFALLSMASKQFERAAALARKLALQPGWKGRGNLLVGQIEFELENPVAAIESLQIALDIRSEWDATGLPVAHRKLLVRALLQVGKHAEAATQLQTVLTSAPDAEAFWLLSRTALQAGTDMAAALKQSGIYGDENPTAPEPAPFIGAAACATCHPAIAKSQQNSHHARTFQRNPACADLALPGQPVTDPTSPKVSHKIECVGGKVRIEATSEQIRVSGLADFVFGSGSHAKTLVGHDEKGREREFRLSHYADGSGWDLTTGHGSKPADAEGFLGRLLAPDDVRSCFYCHTTVARAAREQTGAEASDRAIGCERCHGPGGNHVKAVAGKLTDLAIARPRLARASQVVALAAQCHSPLGREVTPNDPLAARFPSTSLTWSRCYTESGGKLDCRTCHDPHRGGVNTAVAHESKCISCHSAAAAVNDTKSHKKICSVNSKSNCLSCHMPVVTIGVPHTAFTDHYIRVRPVAPLEASVAPR